MAVIKQREQRVGIFIDTQNLYHSAKNIYNGKVNFGNVLEDTLSDRILVRAIAYAVTTEAGDETEFLGALERIGIETKTKDLQVFSGGAKKGDWDVGLAIDCVKLAPKLDVVVIVSGDGDFAPLVEYLKSEGCQVEIASFGKSTSSKLIDVADDFINLDENPRRYLLKMRR